MIIDPSYFALLTVHIHHPLITLSSPHHYLNIISSPHHYLSIISSPFHHPFITLPSLFHHIIISSPSHHPRIILSSPSHYLIALSLSHHPLITFQSLVSQILFNTFHPPSPMPSPHSRFIYPHLYHPLFSSHVHTFVNPVFESS